MKNLTKLWNGIPVNYCIGEKEMKHFKKSYFAAGGQPGPRVWRRHWTKLYAEVPVLGRPSPSATPSWGGGGGKSWQDLCARSGWGGEGGGGEKDRLSGGGTR